MTDTDINPEPTPLIEILLDAAEVTRRLTEAIEHIEVWMLHGTGTPAERVRLYARLSEYAGNNGRLNALRNTLAEHLAPDLDGPIEVDGIWYGPTRTKSMTGWRKAELVDEMTRLALMNKLDAETGELRPPTAAEAIDRLWRLAEPATSRTGVLKDVGIDPDEYCTTKWKDTVAKIAAVTDPE